MVSLKMSAPQSRVNLEIIRVIRRHVANISATLKIATKSLTHSHHSHGIKMYTWECNHMPAHSQNAIVGFHKGQVSDITFAHTLAKNLTCANIAAGHSQLKETKWIMKEDI